MRSAALKASAYPLLKVKIGSDDGLAACLAVMEARPDAELIIDANEALSPDTINAFQSALSGRPVVMIEQPLPRAHDDRVPNTPKALPIFCADESLHTAKDLDRLWDAGYRAVNVKLDKCGGLTAGLELVRAAKAKGFIIMAGCMVGTSLAMAPIMMLESFADYIDLDGPLLLAKDREKAMRYEGPIIHPAEQELWG
jgi:L-alanine-DL-glutamate epimerase-like enolase superfamily enzyme